MFERSDEQATRRLGRESLKIQNQNKKRDDKKWADDALADLPEWLTKFKENLVKELLAPANSSLESDLEHPTKVATKSRKHSIETHFPKDRNCDVCLRTKITRAPCRRRTGEAEPHPPMFGDSITEDHKVVNEEGESRNNHRHAVVVQDLATQWIQFNDIRAKQKLLRRRKKFVNIFGAVIQTESSRHRQLDGIGKSM